MDNKVAPPVPPGIYEHPNGIIYRVIHLAQCVETGKWFIIYSLAAQQAPYLCWAHSYSSFREMVATKDGNQKPRFQYLPDFVPIKAADDSILCPATRQIAYDFFSQCWERE